jgi:chromosome segregation ATPase
MKRSIALIISGCLTALVGTAVFLLMAVNQAHVDNTDVAETNQVVVPEATTYQQQQESFGQAIQEREAMLQTQIQQRQTTLTQLDSDSQAEINRLQAELIGLQNQIEQTTQDIQSAESNMATLQRTIQQDDLTYQNEVTIMTNAETELQIELKNTINQLNAAYAELATRQSNPSLWASSGGSSGSSSNNDDDRHESYDDDDDDRHESHDDDDDDRHESHDDDD